MALPDLSGTTALVTGASSGLGVAFARQLAARGAGLVLSARRTERLETLASELEREHGTACTVATADLARPGGAAELIAAVEAAGVEPGLVINNAGHGAHGDYVDLEPEALAAQLGLNAVSVAELCHHHARAMRARGGGRILNVSSMGALVAVPGYAAYSASKAFVLHLSQALAHELRGSGVDVCCVCPGGMRTEFFEAAAHEVSPLVRLMSMEPGRVATIALTGLFAGKTVVVPGLAYRLGVLLIPLVPRRLAVAVSGATMA